MIEKSTDGSPFPLNFGRIPASKDEVLETTARWESERDVD